MLAIHMEFWSKIRVCLADSVKMLSRLALSTHSTSSKMSSHRVGPLTNYVYSHSPLHSRIDFDWKDLSKCSIPSQLSITLISSNLFLKSPVVPFSNPPSQYIQLLKINPSITRNYAQPPSPRSHTPPIYKESNRTLKSGKVFLR